jgi:hypothetical protein
MIGEPLVVHRSLTVGQTLPWMGPSSLLRHHASKRQPCPGISGALHARCQPCRCQLSTLLQVVPTDADKSAPPRGDGGMIASKPALQMGGKRPRFKRWELNPSYPSSYHAPCSQWCAACRAHMRHVQGPELTVACSCAGAGKMADRVQHLLACKSISWQ